MACDIPTPSMSTVVSKSAFSVSNIVLKEHRTKLTSKMLECLVYLKEWNANLRLQVEVKDITTIYRFQKEENQ